MNSKPFSILKTYEDIISLTDYRPSGKVNNLFTKLVGLALSNNNQNLLSPSQIKKLQNVCSEAEYELEKYWAEKIIKSPNPKKTLEEFPYLENYRKLTQLEWFSLLSCSKHKNHTVLFVGGGPLPLTAIILASSYIINRVTVLDINPEACMVSNQLIRKMNLQEKIKILHVNGSEYKDYGQFNTVFVAALAGIESNAKRKILQQIKDESLPQTHILARSSWGMRKILYKPLEKETYNMFTPLVEVRPHNDIVNSVFIFKV